MVRPFHSFVVFAEMRTGSNFLEANLNAFAEITCHGEAFNPQFMCYPSTSSLFGLSKNNRDRKPHLLLEKFAQQQELAGFRYFHDHDPRILDGVLEDTKCAKITLTRNVLDSYVSWKIARCTGQWKLTDVSQHKTAQIDFDADEFREFEARRAVFQRKIMRKLQETGQTAFCLTYEDLRSLDVINGLAKFLGVSERAQKLDARLKVQNPEPLSSKVSNIKDLEAELSKGATDTAQHIPDFESRRRAAVRSYVIAAKTPLIYLPIRGGKNDSVLRWMASLDGIGKHDLHTQKSRKDVLDWKHANPGHRSFTVIQHPIPRAHRAFCSHILGTGPIVFRAIRQTLVKRHGLLLPDDESSMPYGVSEHRAAFAAFLIYLKANLKGQTATRIDPAWCSQALLVQGFSQFAAPDLILREDELSTSLPALALQFGHNAASFENYNTPDKPYDLSEIYDKKIEALAASAYKRDYAVFGFDSWQ